MPQVSVIIPTYNHAHFLAQAVQSVFEQTFQDFEIIVIDDGSTDNTSAVAQQYTDNRFNYFFQENRGLAASRNTGLRAARGEYVAFLDADDIFLPCKLEVQVDWFETHPSCGMVVSGYHIINGQGDWITTYTPWTSHPTLELKDWLFNCPVSPNAVLVRKFWIDRVEGFDEQLRRVEDWDLWLRLTHAGCKAEWVKEIVSGYRVWPGQMTRNAAEQKRVSIQVLDKFFRQEGIPDELRALKPEIYARHYIVHAAKEYDAGQCEDARESVANAIECLPELTSTRQSELTNKLVSYALNPYVTDPMGYIRRVYDNLPETALSLQATQRWALGKIGLHALFAAYQSRNWCQVRQATRAVALNAPERMYNRGVWSILWQSLGK